MAAPRGGHGWSRRGSRAHCRVRSKPMRSCVRLNCKEEGRMSVVYNQIANRSLERIGALSDGLFAIAMTLIVLEIQVPQLPHGSSDQALATALLGLGPRFVTYLLSFLTLGIFWNGQQTQLSYVDRGNRDLAWLELVFLAVIALFPFTTSLLAENIDIRL